MGPFMTGVAAGVLGTVAMDTLNHLVARTGLIVKIDPPMLGRMAAGWARGRFRYRHPEEVAPVSGEKVLGILTHYAIGLGLAVPFVVGWDLAAGALPSPGWTIVYGIATTAASWLLVYPSLGLGACGLRSPDGGKNARSSLLNHLFFGVGMAAAVVLA
jgi:hypothetical protein